MKDIECAEKQLVSCAEREQDGPHVVVPHDRIGREICDFVRALSLQEGGVHLDPVAGDVQGYQDLEGEEVGGIEVTQDYNQTRSGTPVRRGSSRRLK